MVSDSLDMLIPYIPLVFILILFIVGFYDYNLESQVNPEYIAAVLTASSIIFGFWAVLLEKNSEIRVAEFRYKHNIKIGFFLCIALLLLSVVFIYFTSLNKIPSAITLWLGIFSFIYNTFLLGVTLYYEKFT